MRRRLASSSALAAANVILLVAAQPAASSGNERFYLGGAEGKQNSSVGAYVRGGLIVQAYASSRRRCFEYGEQVSAGRGSTEIKRIELERGGRFRKRTHTRFGGNPKRRATSFIEGTISRSRAEGSYKERFTAPIPGGTRVCKTGVLVFQLERVRRGEYVRAIDATGLDPAPGLRHHSEPSRRDG